MRVIVCGGRDYDDEETVHAVLSALGAHVTLVHGAAPGADRLANDVWDRLGMHQRQSFPADWGRFGKAAGPIRNQEMADAGADLCIAFPGGRGTADMKDRARKAGIPVLEVAA